MIKFFRHIRHRLLSESKLSKYLLYGLGEIVLVVIGILIALQINNWNEAKKDHSYEMKMVSEIKKGLKADKENLQENIEAYTTLKNTVGYFNDLTRQQVVFDDTMYGELWNLNIGRYYKFNKGPYDALKSSGIDRISDDSLRNHLINFFDFKLDEFRIQMDHATRRYRSNVELLLSMRVEPYLDESNVWVVNVIPRNILQEPTFIWLLADIEWRANNALGTINGFIPEIDALIQHINDEVGQ